jgi:hypothetical protein
MGWTIRWERTRVSQFGLRPQLADSALFVADDKEIHRTNTLGALCVSTDLADAIYDFDGDALLGEVGKEAADRLRDPTRRFSDHPAADTFVAIEHARPELCRIAQARQFAVVS